MDIICGHWLWVANARRLSVCLVHFSEIFEIIVLQGLPGGHAVTIIVDKQFGNDLLGIWGNVRYKFGDAGAFLMPKVELHVRGHSLKFLQ